MKKLLKEYKHAWVFIYFIFYLPWYFGLQLRDLSTFTDLYGVVDKAIPFTPIYIYAYVYWFLFVAITICYLFFKKKIDDFYKCVALLFGGMTICLMIFTVFPTTFLHRPDVLTGTPVEKFLLQFIYGADKPTNVFPSIHVYNSIGCAIAWCTMDEFKDNHVVKIWAIVSAILITLSTMYIKQHSFYDAIGASVIAIILYYVIYVKELHKPLFNKLDTILFDNKK